MTRNYLPILMFLLVLFSLTSYGCNGRNPITNNPPSSGSQTFVSYFWCTAVKDAYVSSVLDYNHGGYDWNNVGTGQTNGWQRTYIEFYLPQLPAGAVITDAHINVYENSQQWPGQSSIDVALANGDWDPTTITWSNQPNPPGAMGAGPAIGAYSGIPKWRGTDNIAGYVQDHMDDPSSNNGFVLVMNDYYGNWLRSFASLNHATRTADNMGQAPRLMLRIETNAPLTNANVLPSGLPIDNELTNRLTGLITVSEQRFGISDWPSDWDVATN
jgi:hypothetical protein